MNSTNGAFLYPSVTSIPGASGSPALDREAARGLRKPGAGPSEFDQAFKDALSEPSELQSLKQPLKFSNHATQRLQDRKIKLDPETLGRIGDAIDKADSKGIQDTLVLTKDAALIVNVKNRTVVTAMDKGALQGNVFTNIDGAVIV